MRVYQRVLAAVSLLLFGGLIFAAVPASASELFPSEVCQGRDAVACQDSRDNTPENPIFGGRNSILTQVVNILAFVIGVAAVIMLVVGGISYMLASGDPGKINSAKNTIIYALIGIVVAVVARGIIALVVNRL